MYDQATYMAEKLLLWVEVGAHAVRKKPGRNGAVWSGQALEEYKQRKRKRILELLRKARALEAEK
jgi:hypothetical protein